MLQMPIIKIILRAVVAVILAVACGVIFDLPEKIWLPLAALFVMQTAIGVVLRQGIERYLLLSGSVLFIYLLGLLFPLSVVAVITAVSMGAVIYFFGTGALLFVVLIAFAVFFPVSGHEIIARLYTITLGSFLGIVIRLIIFPDKIEVEFRQAMVPILQAGSDYFSVIVDLYLKQPGAKTELSEKKRKFVRSLTSAPSWVFEPGLSLPFRSGHRHFLVRTMQLSEVLFSLDYIARHDTVDKKLQPQIEACKLAVINILAAFNNVLTLKKTAGIEDFASNLEKLFQETTDATAFIYDLKDIRMLLVKLAEALR